jgi:type II secretory pathway pseudopilin PulG
MCTAAPKAAVRTACPMPRGEGGAPLRRQTGFTYIGLLVMIVLIGLMLAATGEVAGTAAQRERERELLFIGHQYRDAIARFYHQNHRYPQELAELIESATSGPQSAHFLRRLYADPMTGATDWVLLPSLGGGIMGVASASTRAPLKRAGFDEVDVDFQDAETYAGWTFVYDPLALRQHAPQGVHGPTGAP